MLIAALYDIHGNMPALEAVLQEVASLNIDQIVVGGDVVLGPMSRECLDILVRLPITKHFIYGNCEVSVLAAMKGTLAESLPETVLQDILWTADQLQPEHRELMERWPKTLSMTINGLGEVLFCHGTPRSENENFTRLTPESKLIPIFEDIKADIVVCGHTHMQFDRYIGKIRVINAGSIGMPFAPSGAYWLLMGSDGVELRCTSYDTSEATSRILKTDYPHAHDFAENNVVNPPTEQAMLEIFEGKKL